MSKNWHHEHHTHEGKLTGAIRVGESFSFTRHTILINPTERSYHRHSYVLWFGAYGWTRLHVYADNLEDALEECAEWLSQYAPGLITTPGSDEWKSLMQEACEELGLAWPLPSDVNDMEPYWQAEEQAMVDCIRTEAGWLDPEWGVALEDPTAEELYQYVTGV